MRDDDEICLCFHVTQAKLKRFLRRQNPQRASQMSECLGAGTGCGWCRPFLRLLFQQHQSAGDSADIELTAEKYAEMREQYKRKSNYQQ